MSTQEQQARRYRAYTIDGNDRICNSHDVLAADDEAAIEAANAILNDRVLELWDGARKILRIEPIGGRTR